MAKTYTQIQQQIAVLPQKAEAARRKEIAGVVKRINVAIRHYGLTPGDVDFASAAGARGAAPAKGAGKAKGTGSAVVKSCMIPKAKQPNRAASRGA